MQFRFRKYNAETNDYKLVTIINVDDYAELYKTFDYMIKNKVDCPIELNTESFCETVGESLEIISVAFCVDKTYGEEAILPHFVVDVE